MKTKSQFIMKTKSQFSPKGVTFKTASSTLLHLRSLAQFATFIEGSCIPLVQFDLSSDNLLSFLNFYKRAALTKPLYLVYRTVGFKFFSSSAEAVLYKKLFVKSFIASYTVRYVSSKKGFSIEPIELTINKQ